MDEAEEETFEVCLREYIYPGHYYDIFNTLIGQETYTVTVTPIDEYHRSVKVFEKDELFCEFNIERDRHYLIWLKHGKYEGRVSYQPEWHVMFYNDDDLHDDGTFAAVTLYDRKGGDIIRQQHYKKGYPIKDPLVKCCRKA
tara:strand:- start:822 stop:1244 length:423 start_codon:yes stop_codon:yes gene_type:complete